MPPLPLDHNPIRPQHRQFLLQTVNTRHSCDACTEALLLPHASRRVSIVGANPVRTPAVLREASSIGASVGTERESAGEGTKHGFERPAVEDGPEDG